MAKLGSQIECLEQVVYATAGPDLGAPGGQWRVVNQRWSGYQEGSGRRQDRRKVSGWIGYC